MIERRPPCWPAPDASAQSSAVSYSLSRARQLLAETTICFRQDAPEGDPWYQCDQLITSPQLWLDKIRAAADYHQVNFGHPVAALSFQRYCHRVAGITVGLWLMCGQSFDPAAANCELAIGDLGVSALRYRDQHLVVTDPATLMQRLVDDHLYPVALITHKGAKSSLGNLRGDMSAGIALGAEFASHWQPAEVIYARLRPLLDARPDLDRLGEYETYVGPCGERVRYERRSCCHAFEVSTQRYCCWCSLIPHEERVRRITESVAEEGCCATSC